MKNPRLARALLLPMAVTALVVAAAPAPAKDARVAILSIVRGYDPARVTVAAGETVTWVNEDADALHNAVCDASCPEPFSSGRSVGKGGVGSYRFTKVGAYRYHCELHPNMVADVVVVEAAPTTTTTTSPAAPTMTTTTSRAGATTSTSTPAESTTTTAPAPVDAPLDSDVEKTSDPAGDADDDRANAVPIVFAAVLATTALLAYLATRSRRR